MNVNFVPKFIDEAVAPPARSVGNTLSNLWELGVGNHVNLWVQKQEIKLQSDLQKFKEKIEEKTQSIPIEDLVDPQISVVGPAIEASKYYIDSDELREMFANLIASSIDKKKVKNTHPSFVEIIKQLSPLDAQNFKIFKQQYQFPVCEYRLINDSGGYTVKFSNVFLENKTTSNKDLIASSLENLSRLGLILIDYASFITAEGIYKPFENTPEYVDLTKELSLGLHPKYEKVEVKGGLTKLTPLGKTFTTVCIN